MHARAAVLIGTLGFWTRKITLVTTLLDAEIYRVEVTIAVTSEQLPNLPNIQAIIAFPAC